MSNRLKAKCDAACFELKLGDICSRCEGVLEPVDRVTGLSLCRGDARQADAAQLDNRCEGAIGSASRDRHSGTEPRPGVMVEHPWPGVRETWRPFDLLQDTLEKMLRECVTFEQQRLLETYFRPRPHFVNASDRDRPIDELLAPPPRAAGSTMAELAAAWIEAAEQQRARLARCVELEDQWRQANAHGVELPYDTRWSVAPAAPTDEIEVIEQRVPRHKLLRVRVPARFSVREGFANLDGSNALPVVRRLEAPPVLNPLEGRCLCYRMAHGQLIFVRQQDCPEHRINRLGDRPGEEVLDLARQHFEAAGKAHAELKRRLETHGDRPFDTAIEASGENTVAMSEGPKPRAADDFDTIRKSMQQHYLNEGRLPPPCAPGQHNFTWDGTAYWCSICRQGKPQDGR